MSIFNNAVLQGLNAIGYLRYIPGQNANSKSLAVVTGSSTAFMEQHVRKLRMAGIINVKRGPGGGYSITKEQLRTKRVRDVLDALGQPCYAPEGPRASDRIQRAFYGVCDVTLEEFFG